MNVFHRALAQLGVEDSERSLFVWGGACLGFSGAAAFALLNTAETLFLKRVGVEYLPLVLLGSSALLVASTTAIGRFLSNADRPRWLPRLLVLLALMLVPFFPLIRYDVPGFSIVLVLASRQVLALSILVFWQALNDLVTARQAKRLFAPLSSGITVGGIVGSFASEPVSRIVGLEGVPLVCAVLLMLSAHSARRLRVAQPRRLDRGLGGGAPGRPAAIRYIRFRDLWRESALFRLLLIALFCGGLLSPVLYFQFSYVADASTSGPDGEQQLLALYAQFRGWLNVAMLGAQLWLSGRLYRRLGLPAALALWPAAYLLGFSWLGFDLVLVAGIASLGAARITEDGISGSALRVLFNLFPDHLRSRAAGLLEGPVNRLGGVTGNALMLGALAIGAGPWIGYAALPVALVWFAAALALRRAYPTLLLQASADRNLTGAGADKAQLLDPATLRALAPHLAAADPVESRAAIELVAEAPPERSVGPLARAVELAPESTRALLVDALHRAVEPLPPGSVRDPDAAEVLGRLLLEGALEPEHRADLLQVFARLTGGDDFSPEEDAASLRVLQRTMGDREAAVRLASIAELVRRGQPPPGVRDLDTALRGALGGRDVLMRRTARKELRAILLSSRPDAEWQARLSLLAERLEQRADRAEAAEALVEVARRHGHAAAACADSVLGWADDPDPRVRAAVLAFSGEAALVDEAPRLARALGSRHAEEAAAAHAGLVAMGAEAALKPVLEQGFGAPAQRDAAIAVLSELEVDPETLANVYAEQLQAALDAIVLRAALGEQPSAPLVARRLEERAGEGLGGLLTLLAVIRDEPQIAELENRLRRTRDERRRDVLIEALESLLRHEDRQDLASLLEPGPWPERGRQAADRMGRRVPSASQAWADLQRDRDPLTRQLTLASRPMDPGEAIGDASDVPTAMDLAVRLQAVPVFDRLGTRELVRLAESLQEERRRDGEEIYAEGDEGESLFFVLEGEVELTKGALQMGRVGPERFFGEVSTLDGVQRPLSARASGDVRLLRLDREALLALMEDAPALGIGLSQHLALQVRELQQRLQDSP